uniref:NADH-ubiquinone oxidoreductase chain 1 n=1 Tax=Acanthocardia tuberculata TaxID=385555 RepID=Q06SA5_ACATU|nr:NADH dehydrogenase subunit 1 [Acanthocardia tuberculata]ABF60133.1 NADH dehydrogenase subunit 1 [Acanthocardia tuberculata]
MADYLVYLLSCVYTMVSMLVSVAFFIVLERKGLGVFQLRHGPNKVGVKGLVQAVADGVKLLSKSLTAPSKANKVLFFLAPVLLFSVSFCIWAVFPSWYPTFYFNFSVFFFLSVSASNVFGLILSGWSSNSVYAMLGAMRAVAQTISYEVCMTTLLLCPLLFFYTFEFQHVCEVGIKSGFFCFEVFLLWFISVLAETNRAPFDFVEGESELVAGYHVEMGGAFFALIALGEYGSMLAMSVFTVALFFSGLSSVLSMLLIVSFSMLFILVRAAVPRYRYDVLMDFCWKVALPLSLSLFVVCLALS